MQPTSSVVFTDHEVTAIIDLAAFSYNFSAVNRGTYLPNGENPETDGTHTVVLAVIGIAITLRYFPWLDCGEVAKLCVVHDLVEAYAGDTSTLQIDEAGRKAKAEREAAALARMEIEFGEAFPEFIELIHVYEQLDTPEAKFVKMLDKLMPMLSHILNHGVTLHRAGIGHEAYREGNIKRTQEYLGTTFGRENPELMALRDALRPFLEKAVFGSKSRQ